MNLAHIWRCWLRVPSHVFAKSGLGILALILSLLTAPAPVAGERDTVLVAFGDSLTAGFGLAPEAAFPRQLEKALRARGHAVRVVNAGVSGDTASAGLTRLKWAVPEGADAVILELGANDALRGLDPDVTRAALERIIAALKADDIAVLLAGMRAPRNLGPEYGARFDAIYPALAEAHGLLLYPFFLDGVAAEPALNLPDGLHPNAKGVAVIVERILPSVEELLRRLAARRAALSTQN